MYLNIKYDSIAL